MTSLTEQLPADALGPLLLAGLEALPSSRRLTTEQLEVIYSIAYAHAAQHQYQHALPYFALLAQYGPTRSHYLAGLALSLQMVTRYEEAIDIYSLMLLMFPSSLAPALHVAECQIALGQAADAKETLQRVLRAEEIALHDRARVLLERLSRTEAAIA